MGQFEIWWGSRRFGGGLTERPTCQRLCEMPTVDKTIEELFLLVIYPGPVSEERIRSSVDGYLAGFSGFTNARSDLAEKFKERVLLITERSEQIQKIIEKGGWAG